MATLASAAADVRTKEKPVARTIRDLRHERGLQLTAAAREIGIHAARLSELERGERPPTVRERCLLSWFYETELRVVVAIVEDEA